jgi:FkbM family methyltransferase
MSKVEFRNDILRSFYHSLHRTVDDNYDRTRFSFDGVDRSKTLSVDPLIAYFKFFNDNIDGIYGTYLALADAESRKLFVNLILYRMVGHVHLRIREGWTGSWLSHHEQEMKRLSAGDADVNVGGIFGPLQRYVNFPFRNKKLNILCWPTNMVANFVMGQYFYENGGVRVQPELGDVCVDAGACFGDTAVTFAAATGAPVHAFELQSSYHDICLRNAHQNGMSDLIQVNPFGLWDKTQNIGSQVNTGNRSSPGFSVLGQEQNLPLMSLDDYVTQRAVERIDFIKMDIEGAELSALRGARAVINRFRPKLAICLYHKFEDYIAIPQYLMENFPFYKFHLGHYSIHAEETVLYARPVT